MPTFPFPRSVGADLRAVFAHDRLAAQANRIGYSSISPGEGSLDILDANENAIARYGYEGSVGGFLLQRGGAWVTIQTWTEQEIAATTSGLESRVTTAEGRLDSHASRIGAAENDIDSLESTKVGFSTYNVLAGRVGAAENDINDIKNGTTPLQSPTLVAPKMTGLSSGGTGSGWVALMINTSTGQIRMYGD